MATATYDLLDSINIASGSYAEFTGLDTYTDYKDLVFVLAMTDATSSNNTRARFNSDTGSNYSVVVMEGNGSSASSSAFTQDHLRLSNSEFPNLTIFQVFDFNATDKHKSCLARSGNTVDTAGDLVSARALRWANTAAITSVRFFPTSGGFSGLISVYGIAS